MSENEFGLKDDSRRNCELSNSCWEIGIHGGPIQIVMGSSMYPRYVSVSTSSSQIDTVTTSMVSSRDNFDGWSCHIVVACIRVSVGAEVTEVRNDHADLYMSRMMSPGATSRPSSDTTSRMRSRVIKRATSQRHCRRGRAWTILQCKRSIMTS
jgi:hypothetical protein